MEKNNQDNSKLITDELIIRSQFVEVSIGRLVKNIFKKAEIMDNMIQESTIRRLLQITNLQFYSVEPLRH